MKTICILMSTYNGGQYIDQQLNSIYNQELFPDLNIKLLIRDDGSDDDTIKIINEWKQKLAISFFDGKNNLGPAKSFWYLLKKAPLADYYAFSDQDDLWDPDKLIVAIKSLIKRKNKENTPLLYACQARERRVDSTVEHLIDYSNYKISPINILINGSFEGCSMVFNNAARFEALKQDPDLIPMHDFAMLISTILTGKVIFDEEPHFTHVIHDNNADTVNKKQNIFKRVYTAIKKWNNSSTNKPLSPYLSFLIKRYYQNFNKEDLNFYQLVRDYRSGFLDKVKIFLIVFKNRDSRFHDSERSFMMRMFFNKI